MFMMRILQGIEPTSFVIICKMKSYPEYYQDLLSDKEDCSFYNCSIFELGRRSDLFYETVKKIGLDLGKKMDSVEVHSTGLLKDFSEIWELKGLEVLADEICPILEKELYGCNIFVDKVYCYRNIYSAERDSSWLWHWDNNPDEVYKVMIYLSDVGKENGPFEYLVSKNGVPVKKASSRTGISEWKKQNSRVGEKEMTRLLKAGKTVKVIGEAGTQVAFNNNVVHRANIPYLGMVRDVLILRVRPTKEKLPSYIDPKWTSTSLDGSVVPINPDEKAIQKPRVKKRSSYEDGR